MENDEFDDERNDKELVLEILKFSTIPLLYMTKDTKKILSFIAKLLKLTV